MENAIRRHARTQAQLESGYVVAVANTTIVVMLGDVRVSATRAAGCLRAPQPGDHVLVALVAESSFVVTVLESESPGATIDVMGDLDLAVREGKLAISAQRGVEVHSLGDAELTAPRARMRVIDAELMVDQLRWLGEKMHLDVAHVSTVVKTMDSIAQRVRQRAERAYRFVTEFDQLRAGHIDHRAQGTVRMHGENTVLTANELAKIDGEQIHVG